MVVLQCAPIKPFKVASLANAIVSGKLKRLLHRSITASRALLLLCEFSTWRMGKPKASLPASIKGRTQGSKRRKRRNKAEVLNIPP